MKKRTWCNYLKRKKIALVVGNIMIIPILMLSTLGSINYDFFKIHLIISLCLSLFVELSLVIDLVYHLLVPVKEEKIGIIVGAELRSSNSIKLTIRYKDKTITTHCLLYIQDYKRVYKKEKYLIGKEVCFYFNKKKDKVFILHYYE